MARLLQQIDPRHGDYTAERDGMLGSPTVDQVMDELERNRKGSAGKVASWHGAIARQTRFFKREGAWRRGFPSTQHAC